jgi:hypothetical protein
MCSTIIGARCKRLSMFLGAPGAENDLALRPMHSSRHLAEFWRDWRNAHVVRYGSLALPAWRKSKKTPAIRPRFCQTMPDGLAGLPCLRL